MKLLKSFALMCAIALLLSGCDKSIENMIVGTWNVDEVRVITIMDGDQDTDVSKDVGTMVFISNGTGTVTVNDDTEAFEWSSVDDKLVIMGVTYTVTTKTRKEMIYEKKVVQGKNSVEAITTLSRK